MLVTALPALEAEGFGSTFTLPRGREVTSLAITPNGCYLIAGFLDGAVRLYAVVLDGVGGAVNAGTLVGRITPKGMNSSLRINVVVSEDCRFCFAGVLRGSTELMAADLSRLPTWETKPSKEAVAALGGPVDLKPLLRVHRRSDAKLKGFGAATRVRGTPSEGGGESAAPEYRLFCGRGIKSIHVWTFRPLANGPGGEPAWQCIYDTQTNGMTVELVAFRRGGLEGVSKSDDQLLRVWDLTGPDRKPQCRDIPNSRDATCAHGDFAYGGRYQLSMVRIDADEWANRTELALPPPPDGDVAGSGGGGSGGGGGLGSGAASPGAPPARALASGAASPFGYGRRRHCRMIKSVTGTVDGRHVLLVCSDGQVLYHRHTEAITGSFLPLSDLLEDPEDLSTVAVGLVGGTGLPVVIAAGSAGGKLEVRQLPRTKPEEEEDVATLGTMDTGAAGGHLPTTAFSWQERDEGEEWEPLQAVRPGEDGDDEESSSEEEEEEDEEELEVEKKERQPKKEDIIKEESKVKIPAILSVATLAPPRRAVTSSGARGGGASSSASSASTSSEAEMEDDDEEENTFGDRERQNSGAGGRRRRSDSHASVPSALASGRDSPGRSHDGGSGGGANGNGKGAAVPAAAPARRKPGRPLGSGKRIRRTDSIGSELGAAEENGGGGAGSGKKGRKRLRESSGTGRGDLAAEAAAAPENGSPAAAMSKQKDAPAEERAPGHGAAVKRPRTMSGAAETGENDAMASSRTSSFGGGGADPPFSAGKPFSSGKAKQKAKAVQQEGSGSAKKDAAGGGGVLPNGDNASKGERANRTPRTASDEGAPAAAEEKPERRKLGRPSLGSRSKSEGQAAAADANKAGSGGGEGKRGRRSTPTPKVAMVVAKEVCKLPSELPMHLVNFLAERRKRRVRELQTDPLAVGAGHWDRGATSPAAVASLASIGSSGSSSGSDSSSKETKALLLSQQQERLALELRFRAEHERLRRSFLAAVDRARLMKEVEAAGIEVQHGCATLAAAGWRLRERPDRSQVPLQSLSRRDGAMTRRDAHHLAAELAAPAGGGGSGTGGDASVAVVNGWNVLEVEDAATRRIEAVVADFREALDELLKVQAMHAGALAAMQAAALPPQPLPPAPSSELKAVPWAAAVAAVPRVEVPFRWPDLLCLGRQ